MKISGQLAAFAAAAAAQQFVMYTPGGDDTLVERADPIITPGELSGHVHQFFGSNAIAPELSYEALQKADCTTVGAADGTGNSQDNSNYWHPAMYAKKKDGSGYMKIPTGGHKMYYRKAGTGKFSEPFGFPQGFRMIAGDPFQRQPNSDASTNAQNITQWICHSSSGNTQGADGGFPSSIGQCDSYPGFNGAIHFPHCWNGNDFDQSDPHAHMAYPEGNIESGECPSSHPTIVPHIFMENMFDINSVYDQIDTSTIVLAQGDNTGYGWHADFFNGWIDGAIDELINSCPQGAYGNQDVGACPAYKPYTKRASECTLQGNYKEDVQNPGPMLPGCNPILDTNPAPVLAVAALGVSTDKCGAGSGAAPPSGNSSSPDAYPSSPSEPASSASGVISMSPAEVSSPAPPPMTTMATATYAPAPSAADYDVVYVTEWVTTSAAPDSWHGNHRHMRAHKRREY